MDHFGDTWGRFFQSLRFVKASLRAERSLATFGDNGDTSLIVPSVMGLFGYRKMRHPILVDNKLVTNLKSQFATSK